jgi:anti-sigma B factor antagonist
MDELIDGPRATLQVSAEPDGGPPLLLRFAGDLDLAGVSDLTGEVDALLAQPPQPVLLDLADVVFCDSSGVALLIRLANHFQRMHIRAATPPVHRVIEVLGLAERLGLDGA